MESYPKYLIKIWFLFFYEFKFDGCVAYSFIVWEQEKKKSEESPLLL